MKESPILFSGEMVQAILDGRKTMTRRVVKPQPYESRGSWLWEPPHRCCVKNDIVCDMADNSGGDGDPLTWCRFQVGDRLWVRETWQLNAWGGSSDYVAIRYRADNSISKPIEGVQRSLIPKNGGGVSWKWRPSIHMPRWASRLTLEITDVRAERLNAISEEDAKAEGFQATQNERGEGSTAVDWFRNLWDRINGKRFPWAANPWCWAISFRRLESET